MRGSTQRICQNEFLQFFMQRWTWKGLCHPHWDFFASILEAFEPPWTYFWRLFLHFGGKSPTIVAISLTNWSQGRRRSAATGFGRPTGMPEGLKLESKMEDLCIFSELLSQQLRLWQASLFLRSENLKKCIFAMALCVQNIVNIGSKAWFNNVAQNRAPVSNRRSQDLYFASIWEGFGRVWDSFFDIF